MCFALGGCVHRCSIQYIPQKNMKSAAERAGKFLYDSIADTMNDDTAPNDGVNFEKFLRELM